MKDWQFLYNRYIRHVRIEKGLVFKWYPAPIREWWLEAEIFAPGGGGVMVDVGANVGGWTLPASRYYQYVHSFEPNPEIARILNWNIEKNKIRNVIVHQTALGEQEQDLKPLHIYDGTEYAHGSDSFLKEHMGHVSSGKTVYVQVKRLDDYDFAPDLIKLDSEGWEIPVLKGASRTIRQYKPKLVIETHLPNDDQRIKTLLFDYDFKTVEKNGQIWMIGR
jgi:FkbM family methyltransferase